VVYGPEQLAITEVIDISIPRHWTREFITNTSKFCHLILSWTWLPWWWCSVRLQSITGNF